MAVSDTSQEQSAGAAALTRAQLLALAKTAPEALVDLVLVMQEQIEVLRVKVGQLEQRLAQNSANSHRPPAVMGWASRPYPRACAAKAPAGPVDSPDTRAAPCKRSAHPDHTLVHALGGCPCGHCGGASREGEPLLGYEARQVFELPPRRLAVTEHRAEIKRGPLPGRKVRADFPAGVGAAAQYGPRFAGLLTYLHVGQLLPFARIKRAWPGSLRPGGEPGHAGGSQRKPRPSAGRPRGGGGGRAAKSGGHPR